MANEKFLPPVIDLGNQPVFVATDIEDNVLTDLVCGRKDSPNLGESTPVMMFGNTVPLIERALSLGVDLPEGANFFLDITCITD